MFIFNILHNISNFARLIFQHCNHPHKKSKRLIEGITTRTAAPKSAEITSCIQPEGCLTKEADSYRNWCHGHPYALESLPTDIQNNYMDSDCSPLPFQQYSR